MGDCDSPILFLLFYSVALEEGVDAWLSASEALVECHWWLGAASLEDVFLERLSGSGVEDAVFLELAEGVGVENLGPLVTVVTSSVATREYVSELR